MNWIVRETGFHKERITTNSNKFMIGNGYMGYRGTMEEFAKSELTATTLAGLYDRVGDKWREPVNAPNGLSTRIYCDGSLLSVLEEEPLEHEQELDMHMGLHRRKTVFNAPGDNRVTLLSERFCSAERLHLIVNKITIECDKDCELRITTGIDGDVWDINGPHLERMVGRVEGKCLVMNAWTHELNQPVSVVEAIDCEFGEQTMITEEKSIYRQIIIQYRAGEQYTLVKYVSVFTGMDEVENTELAAINSSKEALKLGYAQIFLEQAVKWSRKWKLSDVIIEGDEEAGHALRYSMYQLHIIAPDQSEKVSIPARGLSGQVYKGAVFWDTEMFMLPFFLYTQPEVARNLMMYRVHTLGGARRKAAEYGFEGAFYAWESQETGDDACTLFNVNDVFTGRPMRTYFRDKQVHISADVAHGIWQYYTFTGDESILLDGGAEVIWECAKFFYSYAYYNSRKDRYEILDVTGPDEYHERVNNNAFTNMLVKQTLFIMMEVMKHLQDNHPGLYEKILSIGHNGPTLEQISHMYDNLYVPQPDLENKIIPQFDGYFKLEDVSLAELKSRIINKNEYLGGGSGLATTTQILKQADVVLMLHLFKDRFDQETKQANWQFYEPRTEHGSSLSSCIYALVASDIGSPDWAYPYFMRTATIDLTGESKQYVGDLYIGGTHPAANGGAWMAAVLGFAGLQFQGNGVIISPALPEKWTAIESPISVQGQSYRIRVGKEEVQITAADSNTKDMSFTILGQTINVAQGQAITVSYKC
ncbi:glycoside hydrolase family 65 protein [Paenibacillus segetis]|uniref:Kojibiose phosphorylase n=1 Tax=Paenibacillus segetis TaxID=1325360 RepID=A0ABQ1YTW6_9BACL|nr:glycoside hydrolase family 65 protein [Paenibacillus segetis]GGH38618.1 kojibiose phosphorylase [Paenibacillus segetis]